MTGAMNTITVTCPSDGSEFVVVEPEDQQQLDTLTVTCPGCEAEFTIVYPNELSPSDSTRQEPLEYRGEEIVEWELREAGPPPYTGSDKEIPSEQYVTASIQGIGGDLYGAYRDESPPTGETDVSGETDRFQIWYTPDHEGSNDEQVAYVVRADVETGVKTKNVYKLPGEPNLYVKNRGVPRNSDKQWTFLDREQCRDRVYQARLDGEMAETDEGRYNIFLEHDVQPLVDDDGELADELVKELGRMLIAFQTKRVA